MKFRRKHSAGTLKFLRIVVFLAPFISFFSRLSYDNQISTTDSCLTAKNTSEITIRTRVAKHCSIGQCNQ